MFSALSKSSIFGCLQQVRNLNLLPRAAVTAIKTINNTPKKAQNGYNIFFTEQYPEFKTQFPDFHVTDIAKRIGAKWNSLSDATKKLYNDRAVKGMSGAQQQREAHKEALTKRQEFSLHMLRQHARAVRGEIKRRSNLTEDELMFLAAMPKPPFLNGRAVFLTHELRKRGGKPVTEIMGSASAAWNSLSAAERSKYEEQAKADGQNYMNAMKKFLLQE